MSKDSYIKRAQLMSDGVDIEKPAQDVDHELAKKTGVALAGAPEIEEQPAGADIGSERFMNELVEVSFSDAANENEPGFVEVTVNGVYDCIRRGETKAVRRSHLAVIARAKQARVVQEKIVAADGSMAYREKFVSQPVYPFSVLSDPSGRKGVEWLSRILKAA